MRFLGINLGGNHNDEQTQPKDEKWIVDQPAKKTDWKGTLYERKEACPDCDGINLCETHFAEIKARFDTELPPQPRLWLW